MEKQKIKMLMVMVIVICFLCGCDNISNGNKAIEIIEKAFQVKLPPGIYAEVEVVEAMTLVINGKCRLSPEEFDRFIYACKYIPNKSEKTYNHYPRVINSHSNIKCYWQDKNDIVACNIGYGKTNNGEDMLVFTLVYENMKQTGTRVKHWTDSQWEY